MTTIDLNKTTSRRWVEAYNERDLATQDGGLAASFAAHAPASLEPEPMRLEAWNAFLAAFTEGFPDLELTVVSVVAEGDLVAQRIQYQGTHTGFFQGLPPTGRKISVEGLELNQLDEDGRVVEHWFHLDALLLLQQVGLKVVPGPNLLSRLLISPLTKWRMKRKG